MVDFFVVLLQPGAGDELQGMKKGVLELADGARGEQGGRRDQDPRRADPRGPGLRAGARPAVRRTSEAWTTAVLALSASHG